MNEPISLVGTENHSIMCPTCKDSWPYADKKDAWNFGHRHLIDTGHSVVLYSEYTEPIHPESIARKTMRGILDI